MLEQQPNEPSLRPCPADGTLASASPEDGACPPSADWVEAQLSRLELLLCASGEPARMAGLLLLDVAPLVDAVQGAVYVLEKGAAELALAAGYAAGETLPPRIAVGEGLLGQCAASRRKLVVSGVSSDFFRVRSALGSSAPATLVFVPVALEAGALAVLELAFIARGPATGGLLDRLAERRVRGEPAVDEPSGSAGVPPALEAPARAGAREPELASGASPSASARQGFWSTLSHELRSPLNSVIVLSQVLAENGEHTLTEKQVHLARVIHGSGKDLLALVDTVALLAKIEARRLILSPGELELGALQRQLSRALEPLAHARGLGLSVQVEPGAPRAMLTDPARARQIVECMLVAAIERTDDPVVRLRIGWCQSGWSRDSERLNAARAVLAFAVDGASGIVPLDATPGAPGPAGPRHTSELDEPDAGRPTLGSLARGGVLGLAISRMLAGLLGGELRQDGTSARFTLYLPAAGGEPRGTSDPGVEGAAGAHFDRFADVAGAQVETGHEREASVAAPRAGELEGFELLLVDPDVRRAFTLTGHLERQGAAVAHADDLGEALDRLRGRRPPSAVLIDARLLHASPEPSVQRLLRLAEQLPLVVLREAGDEGARLPHVHRSSRSADAREVVALLRRVAVGAGSLQTRAR